MTNTSVRLDDDAMARLDVIAGKLAERAAGANVKRSDAMRVALDRGMASLEAELGIAKAKKRK